LGVSGAAPRPSRLQPCLGTHTLQLAQRAASCGAEEAIVGGAILLLLLTLALTLLASLRRLPHLSRARAAVAVTVVSGGSPMTAGQVLRAAPAAQVGAPPLAHVARRRAQRNGPRRAPRAPLLHHVVLQCVVPPRWR
jgi:hypothetical protein